MTGGRALGVLALLVVAALVGSCSKDPYDGECGFEHRYDGARYLQVGDPPRQPRGGRVVGEAERRSCGEVVGHDVAYEVAGASPEVAVVIDGYLLVRRGATPPQRLLQAAKRPVLCARPTLFQATWRGSLQRARNEVPEANEDGSFIRPYRLEIDAIGGDHAALDRWQRLRLTVLVTAETDFAREDEYTAAYDLVPILIATHCDGEKFVADRVDLESVVPEPS